MAVQLRWPQAGKSAPDRERRMFFFNAQPYFGGCNSLLSQPITFSVFRGSG
jgi:hypothetical protein